MEKLVKEVRSSAAARHLGVRQARKASHGLLKASGKARAETAHKIRVAASALGTKLEHHAKERVHAAQEMKTELGQAAERRKAGVREVHSRMCGHLEDLKAERGRMSAQMHESMQVEIAGIRTAVDTLRDGVRAVMGGIGADVAAATRMWRAKSSRMPARNK
jgi:hypothetical protein